MAKALSVVLVSTLLVASVPLAGFGFAARQAWAVEADKSETAAKPKRRQSNSPDNIKKRECDGKWKVYKKEAKPTGWKPYFIFMANCM